VLVVHSLLMYIQQFNLFGLSLFFAVYTEPWSALYFWGVYAERTEELVFDAE
jgi:hypothetical protein